MWGAIHQRISDYLKQPYENTQCKAVAGGDSHQSYVIDNGINSFFIKINEKIALQQFEAEVDSLNHLSKQPGVRVPQVIDYGILGNHSFLILEYIPLVALGETEWCAIGEMVAALHSTEPQAMYGWQQDNFIATTPQANSWHAKWSTFFNQQRIGCLLEELNWKGYLSCNTDAILHHIGMTMKHHQPTPRLLHGDLWVGNIGHGNGHACLFDPAIYYGDREVDIAMTELYGRLPKPFYDAYTHHLSLDQDYEFRKPIYQLYPLLNQALLFGGHYIKAAKDIINGFDVH